MSGDQPALWPDPCPACAATRPEECGWDHDWEEYDYRKRPRGCLNATDPSKTEVPY